MFLLVADNKTIKMVEFFKIKPVSFFLY